MDSRRGAVVPQKGVAEVRLGGAAQGAGAKKASGRDETGEHRLTRSLKWSSGRGRRVFQSWAVLQANLLQKAEGGTGAFVKPVPGATPGRSCNAERIIWRSFPEQAVQKVVQQRLFSSSVQRCPRHFPVVFIPVISSSFLRNSVELYRWKVQRTARSVTLSASFSF